MWWAWSSSYEQNNMVDTVYIFHCVQIAVSPAFLNEYEGVGMEEHNMY